MLLLRTGMLLRKMVLLQPVLVWLLPPRVLGMVVKADGRRQPPYITFKFPNLDLKI